MLGKLLMVLRVCSQQKVVTSTGIALPLAPHRAHTKAPNKDKGQSGIKYCPRFLSGFSIHITHRVYQRLARRGFAERAAEYGRDTHGAVFAQIDIHRSITENPAKTRRGTGYSPTCTQSASLLRGSGLFAAQDTLSVHLASEKMFGGVGGVPVAFSTEIHGTALSPAVL